MFKPSTVRPRKLSSDSEDELDLQVGNQHNQIESGGKYVNVDDNTQDNHDSNSKEEKLQSNDGDIGEQSQDQHLHHIQSGGKYTHLDETKSKCFSVDYAKHSEDIMPYPFSFYKKRVSDIKKEIFAGLTVAFAQVGESIAFSFIAGVGPLLGLHAAWIIGLFTSVLGSRPGMINGATGVQAAVIGPYVKDLGVGYVFYIVILIAAFQAFFGLVRLTSLLPLIPHTVMLGFVNGLAIILAMGQVGQFKYPAKSVMVNVVNATNTTGIDASKVGWLPSETIGLMWILIVVCVVVIVIIPQCKYTKPLPAGICGILAATLIEHLIYRIALGIETPTIGQVSEVNGGLPILFFLDPQYKNIIPPFNLVTLKTAAFPAFIAASTGTIECVLTMEVVNDMTSSGNNRPNQQLYALAFGNLVAGLFGTMGGGATIGLSVMNCMSGANGIFRISGITASLTILTFILALPTLIQAIPIGALVGIMVVTCYKIFDWGSLRIVASTSMPQRFRKHIKFHAKINRTDAITIVVVTLVTLLMDLFVAVVAGILFTGIVYAWKSGMDITVTPYFNAKKDKKIYVVKGPLFFGSAQRFTKLFDAEHDVEEIVIDFRYGEAKIYDYSGFMALSNVSEKYQKAGKSVKIKRLDSESTKRLKKLNILIKYFEFSNDDEPEELIPIKAT